MSQVVPKLFMVARPQVDWNEVYRYLAEVGGLKWWGLRHGEPIPDGEVLAEFAGKMCYRSWEPGLNPNVGRVREDRAAYLRNILMQGHGSVLEHVSYTFVLHDVSRVLTHEWIRHRAGTAISQESMRYVRLDEIPVWFPDWAREDPQLMAEARTLLRYTEVFQTWMAEHFGLDDEGVPFREKKHKTSFMRRFAPNGVATGLVWTANIRAIRHVIEDRTDYAAEEEIQLIAGMLAARMREECPVLFGDYEVDESGAWVTENRKV